MASERDQRVRGTRGEQGDEAGDRSEAPLAAGLLKDHTVPAPRLLSPPDGAVFSKFPRQTDLAWTPVPKAVGYIVNIQHGAGVMQLNSVEPNKSFDFGPGGSARWRVWAILKDSKRSPASESRAFTYTR